MDSAGIPVAQTGFMRLRSIIAPVFSVLLAACSEGTLVPDAGASDAGGSTQDAGRCTGDVAIVGQRCPPMFDGSVANLPRCRNTTQAWPQVVWHCQDLILFSEPFGLENMVCYYDATSHALVGAEQRVEDNTFCGGTTNTIEGGRTNPMCRENAPTAERPCNAPDGGSF